MGRLLRLLPSRARFLPSPSSLPRTPFLRIRDDGTRLYDQVYRWCAFSPAFFRTITLTSSDWRVWQKNQRTRPLFDRLRQHPHIAQLVDGYPRELVVCLPVNSTILDSLPPRTRRNPLLYILRHIRTYPALSACSGDPLAELALINYASLGRLNPRSHAKPASNRGKFH